MEHVEVLRHMKETIKAIAPSEVAALDAAIAALSAPQSDDWVLVPREASSEMLTAAIDAHLGFEGEDEVDAVWAAMISAAEQFGATAGHAAQGVGDGAEGGSRAPTRPTHFSGMFPRQDDPASSSLSHQAVDVGQFRPAVATHQLACRKRVRDCREGLLPTDNLPIYLEELAEANRLLDVVDRAAPQPPAAQQQGDGGCSHEAWEENDGWCKCVDCGHGWSARTAPPSAPVGVKERAKAIAAEFCPRGDYEHGDVIEAIEYALAQQPAAVDGVHELRLCESSRLHLFPDRLYRFTVDPDCSMCAEALSHCDRAAQPGGGK